ncbi:bifunctional 4-hydroxy-3-methylbut-2-enyl diphosphate reductase/30S ribosomal protein S1 [Natranaerobius trueperi]|uniref:4-hydroxy-3-methylbut-2-enyl diphosphate reductase n=1 Tax=Natranaerobius trueperi TaxID=759412 RepID=A0A226BVC5_9FIRM|nr:bifunctional 4-hydroxy-3-methylbut-2-enyl diphosphate reductase/30S ribosomal protein S1 [Natranaerobius trueperi]OWZ82943.1 bifunctional 4-hydroxy-3-methylbut-2-enyl diphosphate reductase/30S ribosomal protein S1 [Natranaerobius trueperi]
MEIVVAQGAGFCSGVKRAVDKAIEASKKAVAVYTLGPIVHNNQVVSKLTENGVKAIENFDDIIENESYLVIRSHGVGPSTFKHAEELGIEIIDATCPFVKKVQRKAKQLYDDGIQVYIIGDPNHPEVIGIKEWTDNTAMVIENKDEINSINIVENAAVVAQTTLREEFFNKIIDKIKEQNENVIIDNTICEATKKRQENTKSLSDDVDLMVVIGGYNSSNTKKLKELASKEGVITYHVETANDLKADWFKSCKKIGVTAGASTPDWTIKEVIEKMKEFENQKQSQESEENKENQRELMEENNTKDGYKRGEQLSGTIARVADEEVLVDVGYKFEGVIPINELNLDKGQTPKDILKEGSKVDVKVVKVDDEEGVLILSKKWADKDKAWEMLQEKKDTDKELVAKVVEEVKGGLVVDLQGVNGFIPASHVDIDYISDLSQYVGTELKLKVIELDRSNNKIVLSHKKIQEEELETKKHETFSKLRSGDIIEGTVKRLTNFGAFIDVGGIDGLCHISEISHSRIDHPENAISVGQQIKVKVLDLDPENGKISLSIKEAQPDPFEEFMKKFQSGDVINGKVARTVDFGAFIEIIPGVEGLCHISQLANKHVAKTTEVVKKGDKVKAKILSIDPEQKKVGLSIKDTEDNNEQYESELTSYTDDEDDGVKLGDMFGDLLGEIKEDDRK